MMTSKVTVIILLICEVFVINIAAIETIHNFKQTNEQNNTQNPIDNLKRDITGSTNLSSELSTTNQAGGVEKEDTVCLSAAPTLYIEGKQY